MNKQVKAQDVKAAADVVVKDADAAAKAAKEALAAQQLLELAETIKRVKAAQEKYASYGQEQVDEIFRAAALAANEARVQLAKMAVAETGMGVIEDKVIKNHFASEYVYNKYKQKDLWGDWDRRILWYSDGC